MYIKITEEVVFMYILILIAISVLIYFMFAIISDIIRNQRERIAILARQTQYAEFHTGIPYYTSSGKPYDFRLEGTEEAYSKLQNRFVQTYRR